MTIKIPKQTPEQKAIEDLNELKRMEKLKTFEVCDSCHEDSSNINDDMLCMRCGTNDAEIITIDSAGNVIENE